MKGNFIRFLDLVLSKTGLEQCSDVAIFIPIPMHETSIRELSYSISEWTSCHRTYNDKAATWDEPHLCESVDLLCYHWQLYHNVHTCVVSVFCCVDFAGGFLK